MESWKNAEVPLEAVLRGIDEAFAKWRVAQSQNADGQFAGLLRAGRADRSAKSWPAPHARSARSPRRPFRWTTCALTSKAMPPPCRPNTTKLAASLRKLAADVEEHYHDLEGLEQHLTVLEEKMLAAARTRQTEEQMLESRRELDRQLRPYRGKMTADQLSMLEKQYLERNLLEKSGLPRLSLFYMR